MELSYASGTSATPLLGDTMVSLPMEDGRQRLARIKPIFADQKLPAGRRNAEREVLT